MKELSIEEKAKAYDEAIERAKKLQETCDSTAVVGWCEYIFPELCESSDERIRKALIDGFTVMKESKNCGKTFSNHNIPVADILAWLEKQGEQKLADKVEPKFKVGDYVVGKYISGYISEVRDNCYLLDYQGFSIDKQDNYHLWTIADAKDGDVLAADHWSDYPSSFVAIYKKQNGEDFDSYCFVGFDGKFYKGENGHSTEEIHPATKEQRDILFQKMHEAGYEWDADKKELKKIENASNNEAH